MIDTHGVFKAYLRADKEYADDIIDKYRVETHFIGGLIRDKQWGFELSLDNSDNGVTELGDFLDGNGFRIEYADDKMIVILDNMQERYKWD